MILETECREEVAFDVDVAPKVGLGKPQAVEPQHHGRDGSRVADDQRERWRAVAGRVATQSQGVAVAQLHRQIAFELAEEVFQRARRRCQPEVWIEVCEIELKRSDGASWNVSHGRACRGCQS